MKRWTLKIRRPLFAFSNGEKREKFEGMYVHITAKMSFPPIIVRIEY